MDRVYVAKDRKLCSPNSYLCTDYLLLFAELWRCSLCPPLLTDYSRRHSQAAGRESGVVYDGGGQQDSCPFLQAGAHLHPMVVTMYSGQGSCWLSGCCCTKEEEEPLCGQHDIHMTWITHPTPSPLCGKVT